MVLNALSLIPAGGESDGFCLNVLRKPGPQADQFIAAFTTQILEMVGVRYRDMDTVLGDAPTLPACTPTWQLLGQNTAYFIARDSGRIDEARLLLERLWELTVNTPPSPNVALELAYFVAVHEKNPVEARRHFALANGQGFPLARVLSEAAILIEEDRSATALTLLNPLQGTLQATKPNATGLMQLVIDQFDDLRARTSRGVAVAAHGTLDRVPESPVGP